MPPPVLPAYGAFRIVSEWLFRLQKLPKRCTYPVTITFGLETEGSEPLLSMRRPTVRTNGVGLFAELIRSTIDNPVI